MRSGDAWIEGIASVLTELAVSRRGFRGTGLRWSGAEERRGDAPRGNLLGVSTTRMPPLISAYWSRSLGTSGDGDVASELAPE